MRVPQNINRVHSSLPHVVVICGKQALDFDFNPVDDEEARGKAEVHAPHPVKRGLVSLPEEWCWSSYCFYFLYEAGPVRVNQGWTKISFRAAS
jgi:hypothetical protein